VATLDGDDLTWKPIDQLRVGDLQTDPVWELISNSGSEMVRPTKLRSLSEYRSGPTHIALTSFKTGGGVEALGYCSPSDASGLDYVQPAILTQRGAVSLWPPHELTSEQIEMLCETFSVGPDELFPMQIECLVPVDGKYFLGVSDGNRDGEV
jgi:hypothetical protein